MDWEKKNLLFGAAVISLMIFFAQAGISYGQQTFSGRVEGDFQATSVSGVVVRGTIEGQWQVNISQNNISATASGSFGGSTQQGGRNVGIGGTWTGRLNPDGRTISGEWTGPGGSGGGAGGRIELTLDLATGIASGNFSGRIPSDNGFEQVSGTWTVSFPVVANLSSPRGRISGAWDGQVTGTVSGAVPVPALGQVNVNTPFSATASGRVDGEWSAAFSGEFLTGSAHGDFNGSATASLSTPIGPMMVEVPISGTFLGALNGDLHGGIRYEGGWTAVSTPGAGVSPGYGGPFSFSVDVSGGVPFNADGTFHGGGTTQQSGFTVTYEVTGNWQVQLTLE